MAGALFKVTTPSALPACGESAVVSLAEAAEDGTPAGMRKFLCYSAAVESLRKFFAKYPGMDVVARMSTVNVVLKMAFPYMWFVGFYVVRATGENESVRSHIWQLSLERVQGRRRS
jgi:hypothetical protein